MNARRIAIAAAAAVAVAAAVDVADAGRRRQRRSVQFWGVEAPLGTPIVWSGSPDIPVLFSLWDPPRARYADVEVQYAFDWDQNGVVDAGEWRPATEDRLDPRGTRASTAPHRFESGWDIPVSNVFVWNAFADLGNRQFRSIEYALTPQGRRIPDPVNPGFYLLATGPGGRPLFASGVVVRMRTLTPRRGHRRAVRGDWAQTDFFGVETALAPSMTIDSIDAGTPLLVNWTAYDADSEDSNGNGQLDLADGEDKNGNGTFDPGRVGVAFDFHIVGDSEDPAAMSDDELASLSWIPCTRVASVGDTDSLDARPGVPVPTTGDLAGVASAPFPIGRHWVFAWDPAADIGTTWRGFILRATPFDETRAVGATVYSRTIVYEAQ